MEWTGLYEALFPYLLRRLDAFCRPRLTFLTRDILSRFHFLLVLSVLLIFSNMLMDQCYLIMLLPHPPPKNTTSPLSRPNAGGFSFPQISPFFFFFFFFFS